MNEATPPPLWLIASVEAFNERARMMVLAFTAASGKIPKVFVDDQRQAYLGQCVALLDGRFVDGGSEPDAAHRELAAHAAAAWRRWTHIEPSEVFVMLAVIPDAANVTIGRKTDALVRVVVSRGKSPA